MTTDSDDERSFFGEQPMKPVAKAKPAPAAPKRVVRPVAKRPAPVRRAPAAKKPAVACSQLDCL